MPYTLPPPPGSTEISARRTPTAKHFDKPSGDGVCRSHVARIHYWDQFDPVTPRYREIDTTLVATQPASSGWEMQGDWADYFCHVARRSNQFSTYRNLEPVARGTNRDDYDEIGIKVAANVVGQLQPDSHSVVYPGVFTRGTNNVACDLRITCGNSKMHHEVEIPAQPVGVAVDMPLDFELDIPAGYDIHIGTVAWDKQGNSNRQDTEVIRIGRTGTPVSEWVRLRRSKVWDQAGREVPIEVDFTDLGNGRVQMTKYIKRSFLISAATAMPDGSSAYPVVTDLTFSGFADTGDGYCGGTDAVWATIHAADPAPIVNTAQTVCRSETQQQGAIYTIWRSFFAFDISSIGAGNVVSAGTLNLEPNAIVDGDNDGDDYISVFEGQQASPTTLATSDYQSFGAEGIDAGERKDLSSLTAGVFFGMSLNAEGISWCDVTGWAQFCVREGHDIVNSAIASSTNNRLATKSTDTTGTSDDPYLELTYSAVSTFTPKVMVY